MSPCQAPRPRRDAFHRPDARRRPRRGRAPPAARRQPSRGRERQPGGLPRAATARLGSHDRAAEPLAQRVLPARHDAAGARRHARRRCGATPVALRGRPQRHFYLANCRALAKAARPDVAFVEAEPFSLAATQWGRALARLGVPFGVQCAENIDRRLPLPVRLMRSRVLRDAAFVATRSDSAGRLARAWGATRRGGALRRTPSRVGGRAVRSVRRARAAVHGRLRRSPGPEQGAARPARGRAPADSARRAAADRRRRAARSSSRGSRSPARACACSTTSATTRWPSGYAQLDVLALPSHTTPTWKEQFGRVIVEALWCGVPVVGSDSGEIPWLIELTGGGLVFPRATARRSPRGSPSCASSRRCAARAGERPAGPPSSSCSRCQRRPTRSSDCCSARCPGATSPPSRRSRADRAARWGAFHTTVAT